MSDRPLMLDLFCGAGGAAVGYHRAGLDVVGVDNRPQPRYPFEFVQYDALEVLADIARSAEPWPGAPRFDAIHASPPCERYCALTRASGTQERHPDLIDASRELMQRTRLPWTLENVPEARHLMPGAVLYCGAAVGLEIVRHRLFQANWPLTSEGCRHVRGGTTTGLYVAFRPRGKVAPGRKVPPRRGRAVWSEAVGIDWMTESEVGDAVPPAYTEHIGHQLIQHLGTLRGAGSSAWSGSAHGPSLGVPRSPERAPGARAAPLPV